MRKALLIAWREYSEALKSKAFLISVAIMPFLMFGGVFASQMANGAGDKAPQRFAVVDHSGVLGTVLKAAAEQRNKTAIRDKEGKLTAPPYELELFAAEKDEQAQRVALCDKVREGGYHAFLNIHADVVEGQQAQGQASIDYYCDRAALDDAKQWFAAAANETVHALRLQKEGIPQSAMARVLQPVSLEGMGLLSVDPKTGKVVGGAKSNDLQAFFVPYALMMLLYMLIMLSSMPLANAVMEEKNQRIVEVMLGSASPMEIMTGKLMGNLSTAMTSAIVYIVGGFYALSKTGHLDAVPVALVPWFLAYLLFAVAMYGAGAIAVGSAVNDAKEAQSLVMPLIMPLIIPILVMMPAIKEPNGMLAMPLSFIPPFTPLMMMLRQAAPGGIPAWQPWVGLVGLAACTVVALWAAARIFRIGLLAQGKTPTMAEMLRWAVKG